MLVSTVLEVEVACVVCAYSILKDWRLRFSGILKTSKQRTQPSLQTYLGSGPLQVSIT